LQAGTWLAAAYSIWGINDFRYFELVTLGFVYDISISNSTAGGES